MAAVDHGTAGTRAVRTVRLGSSPSAIGGARSTLVGWLTEWEQPATTVEDAEIVVSELVTNAFLHGGAAEVTLTLHDRGLHVALEVCHHEPSTVELAPLTVDAHAVHGRGLAIVDVLAARWGVDQDGETRTVWAEFPASVPAPARIPADVLALLRTALAGAPTTAAVGEAVAVWSATVMDAAFASLALPDGDPDHLRLLSVEPLPAASAAQWRRFPVEVDAPVAAAFRTGQAYFHASRSAAVVGFPGFGEALAEAGLTAVANVPLPGPAGPAGVLSLGWTHGHELRDPERDLLGTAAGEIARALRHLPAD